MTAKVKVTYVCAKCGATTPKWAGKCPTCGEWDCLKEEVSAPAPKGVVARRGYAGGTATGLVTLDDIACEELVRISTGMTEFDRVLGGGLVAGGTVVLGGNPGAGKSTILTQTGCHVARGHRVCYFTGEESMAQVKDRKKRLSLGADGMQIGTETNVVAIAAMLEQSRPELAIVDSIQTMYHPDIESMAGSVGQVKGCAAYLNQVVKQMGIALVLVGHINKSEGLAGPMALMHIVDAVLMLSSTEDARYRILRAEKNRFGDTSEIGVFAMTGSGLKVVDNPSAIFLSRAVDAPGSVVTPLWEGSRPMLVEVQALVDTAHGNPRRVTVGMDDKRMAMLLAILNKHSGIQVGDMDVYANIVGGIKVLETSADLPLLLATASSARTKISPADVMAFGELGLSGEVRPCANGQDRLREAAKLGFRRAVVPLANVGKENVPGMEIFPVSTIAQAIDWLINL